MEKNKKNVKEYIVCPKCSSKNIKESIRCFKCGNRLKITKSCPNCAKRNDEGAKKCINCGYSFKNKNSSKLAILLSVLLVIILSILVYLKKENFITLNISLSIKVLGGICILSLLSSTLFYGKKDIVALNFEDKMRQEQFKGFRFFSVSLLSVGLLIFIILMIYLYITIA